MAESLFSLEVHVESVEQVKISCVIPAISFRLLDYPTLLIYHISPVDVQRLRDKARLDGSSKEFIETELRDRYGNIPFQKGKSCLFKASVDNLHIQLQSTPLYVMLIDLWHKKPKLVGSTVISLQNAIGKIFSDVTKLGVSVPSIFQDQGTFDLFNLMGSVIGRVKISYRLLSLGGSLMSHLPAKSVMTQKGQDKNKQKDIKVEADSNELVAKIDDHEKDLYKAVKIPTFIHTEVQTDALIPKEQTAVKYIRMPSVEESEKGDPAVFITNTVCPPPLFYNITSHAENTGGKKPQSVKSKEHYHGNMRNTLDDIDYTYYKPDMVQPDGSCGCASVCVQTDDVQTVMPAPLHEDAVNRCSGAVDGKEQSEDLPLLTALLEELTYLRTQREGNSRESRTELPKKESAMPTIVKEQRKPRECCEQVMAQKLSLLNHNKKINQKVASQKKVKFRQTSLTYGMTKTQLLRLEMNQKQKTSNSRLCSSASKDKNPLYTWELSQIKETMF